jgi:hypothetical protein
VIETHPTTWAHVRAGAVVAIRGDLWKIVSRDADGATTLRNRAGVERTGRPGGGAEVVAVMPTDRPVTMEQASALLGRALGATDFGPTDGPRKE